MFQKIHLFKVSYLLEKKLVITLAKQVDAVISDAHATFQDHKRCKSNNDKEFFSATWSFQIFKKSNLNRVKINVTIYFIHTLDDEEIRTNGYSVVSIPSCKCYCFLQLKKIYIFSVLKVFKTLCVFIQSEHERYCLQRFNSDFPGANGVKTAPVMYFVSVW